MNVVTFSTIHLSKIVSKKEKKIIFPMKMIVTLHKYHIGKYAFSITSSIKI